MSKSSTNSAICPLCKKNNMCSVVSGKPISTCWCMQTNIPESLKNNRITKSNPNQCICVDCIKKYASSKGYTSDQ